MATIDNRFVICPNCGTEIVDSDCCEFCGTEINRDAVDIIDVDVESPGSIYKALEGYSIKKILGLKISGKIDARDFRYIRDKCTSLRFLDLSEVKVFAYKGKDGSRDYYDITTYDANTIPEEAFYNVHLRRGMTSLEHIILPPSITMIGRSSFKLLCNLKKINFPEGLVIIDDNAFEGVALAQIELPSTISKIGKGVFWGCTNLSSIKVLASKPPYINYTFNHCHRELVVPKGTYATYVDSLWRKYIYIIKDTGGVENNIEEDNKAQDQSANNNQKHIADSSYLSNGCLVSIFVGIICIFGFMVMYYIRPEVFSINAPYENEVLAEPAPANITRPDEDVDNLTKERDDAFVSYVQSCSAFIYTLYENYVFGREDFSKVASKILSPEVRQFLIDNYGYELEEGEVGYAIWLFRSGRQDGPSDVTQVERIEHLEENWFRVYYTDMGHECETDLKLEIHDGEIRVSDMRSDEVDYHKRLKN